MVGPIEFGPNKEIKTNHIDKLLFQYVDFGLADATDLCIILVLIIEIIVSFRCNHNSSDKEADLDQCYRCTQNSFRMKASLRSCRRSISTSDRM
jgi:hypothetical protein